MFEPGLVSDGAAHVERKMESRAHGPLHHARRLSARRGPEGVVSGDFVGIAKPPVVQVGKFEPRHLGVLRPAKGALMDKGKMGDIEEVICGASGRRLPHLHRRVQPTKTGVGIFGHDRQITGRLAQTHPDQSVALRHSKCREVGTGRNGRRVRRWNLCALTIIGKGPAVICTGQTSIGHRASRERRFAMRTSIRCSDHPTGRAPVKHHFGSKQRDGQRRTSHVYGASHGIPGIAQRLIAAQHVGVCSE